MNARQGGRILPEGRYDQWRAEHGLFAPAVTALDRELMELTERFARSSERERAAMRAAIAEESPFALLAAFIDRAALFAIRLQDPAWLDSAVIGVAMLASARTDPRDVLVAVSRLFHAAERTRLDASTFLRSKSELADGGVARLIDEFARRQPEHRLLSAFGLEEVATESGPAFIRREYDRYQPGPHFLQNLLNAAAWLSSQDYGVCLIIAGTTLGRVGLPPGAARPQDLDAVAWLQARLETDEHLSGPSGRLRIVLAEAANQPVAQRLAEMFRRGDGSGLSVGLTEGRTFCLLLRESVRQAHEGAAAVLSSMDHVAGGMTAILRRYAE